MANFKVQLWFGRDLGCFKYYRAHPSGQQHGERAHRKCSDSAPLGSNWAGPNSTHEVVRVAIVTQTAPEGSKSGNSKFGIQGQQNWASRKKTCQIILISSSNDQHIINSKAFFATITNREYFSQQFKNFYFTENFLMSLQRILCSVLQKFITYREFSLSILQFRKKQGKTETVNSLQQFCCKIPLDSDKFPKHLAVHIWTSKMRCNEIQSLYMK